MKRGETMFGWGKKERIKEKPMPKSHIVESDETLKVLNKLIADNDIGRFVSDMDLFITEIIDGKRLVKREENQTVDLALGAIQIQVQRDMVFVRYFKAQKEGKERVIFYCVGKNYESLEECMVESSERYIHCPLERTDVFVKLFEKTKELLELGDAIFEEPKMDEVAAIKVLKSSNLQQLMR
jgi:hypothetical protein